MTTGDTADGNTGTIAFTTGKSTGGKGGSITLSVGEGNTGVGGDVTVNAGKTSTSNSAGGKVTILVVVVHKVEVVKLYPNSLDGGVSGDIEMETGATTGGTSGADYIKYGKSTGR